MTSLRWLLSIVLVLVACPKGDPGDTDSDAAGATGAASTADEPTGGGASSLLCEQACAHLEACGGDSIYFTMFGVSGCVSLCERAALLDTGFCSSATVDLYSCLRDGSCEDVAGVPSGACVPANIDYTISCAGCPAYTDGPEGDGCAASADCVHAYAIDFVCEGDTCSCTADDYDISGESVVYASCPAAGVCGQGDAAILAAAEACCDTPFVPLMP